MIKDDCSFDEFFSALENALQNKQSVIKTDRPLKLKCGFTVDGTDVYLMKVKELKYAQQNGVDTTQYFNLKE